uniref:Uncharacterized protein n=1 Tax=Timema poppense TaxID=170557 RepID=A0A7R9D2G0_TIMPO|nr:unnamed protein product [Timema poppensis]
MKADTVPPVVRYSAVQEIYRGYNSDMDGGNSRGRGGPMRGRGRGRGGPNRHGDSRFNAGNDLSSDYVSNNTDIKKGLAPSSSRGHGNGRPGRGGSDRGGRNSQGVGGGLADKERNIASENSAENEVVLTGFLIGAIFFLSLRLISCSGSRHQTPDTVDDRVRDLPPRQQHQYQSGPPPQSRGHNQPPRRDNRRDERRRMTDEEDTVLDSQDVSSIDRGFTLDSHCRSLEFMSNEDDVEGWVTAGHKWLCYVLESVSSVEGSRTRRRRRRRRTRPRSQTPSGENVDAQGGGAAPGPSDQSAFTSKEGTPAIEGPSKGPREQQKPRNQRPPTSKRSEGKPKEAMVNGTSA